MDFAHEPVNILVVDDRQSNLLALQALLHRPDYRLVSARSGEEALALVLRHDFAVILLDVAMPGMDGYQVAAMIREREQSQAIPILFLTAAIYDMGHVFRGSDVGVVDYLRKPIDPYALRAKVAVFVELHRCRKEVGYLRARMQAVEDREQRLLCERAESTLRAGEAQDGASEYRPSGQEGTSRVGTGS